MSKSESLRLKKVFSHRTPMGIMDCSLSPTESELVAACMDGVYRIQLEDNLRAGPHSSQQQGPKEQNGESKSSDESNTPNPETLYAHESYVSSIAHLSADRIVSAGYDGKLTWYSLTEKKVIRTQRLHQFWSWDMAVSPDRKLIASVTGQYLAGDYKYSPREETEPSLRIVDANDGNMLYSLPHVPSVQAVVFSPDSRFVAAGNLMGEVRIFDMSNGQMKSSFTSPDFTSWGIIKSHCYLGGIFSILMTPDSQDLLLAGMGPMRDPMAGNGKQRWQRWRWRDKNFDQAFEPEKVGEIQNDEAGEGLMETLAISPSGEMFAMGGRLRGGDWNLALFDMESGRKLSHLKTGYRITKALFCESGEKLLLAGMQGQPKNKSGGKFPDFGRCEIYELHQGE